jgi:hypothetical protein
MLSEVSQAQKHKGLVFTHMWKIDPKDKHTQRQTWSFTNSKMFVIVELLYGTWGMRERKRECQSIDNTVKHNICEGRGYNDVCWKLVKMGVGGKKDKGEQWKGFNWSK